MKVESYNYMLDMGMGDRQNITLVFHLHNKKNPVAKSSLLRDFLLVSYE